MDLNLVKSDIDLFNVIGDLLLGPKGYVGYDSYTFEDRLGTITSNIKTNTIVKLKNYQNLKLSIRPNEWKYIDEAFKRNYKNFIFVID